MENLKGLELLKTLSLAFGPSGYEYNVAELIKSQISDICEVTTDKVGNVITHLHGKNGAKKVMICAHMDEAGFMINNIDDDGKLWLSLLQPTDTSLLSGRVVEVGNQNKTIKGIICSKAIHSQSADERSKPTPADKLYIEIGAKNKADAEMHVHPGDFGVLSGTFRELGGGLYSAKAIDDRIGCSVMCDMIRRIKESGEMFENDFYFAFLTRGKLSQLGGLVASNEIMPDISVVIDAIPAADISDVPEQLKTVKVGGGAAIPFSDGKTIYSRELIDYAVKKADESVIKYQYVTYPTGDNDAGNIHKSGGGVKTLLISVPVRNIGSACSVFSKNDYNSALELAVKIIGGLVK